jgi:hypothetical protein
MPARFQVGAVVMIPQLPGLTTIQDRLLWLLSRCRKNLGGGERDGRGVGRRVPAGAKHCGARRYMDSLLM